MTSSLRRERDANNSKRMKQHPGRFPDSITSGGWKGNSHDGTLDARRMTLGESLLRKDRNRGYPVREGKLDWRFLSDD